MSSLRSPLRLRRLRSRVCLLGALVALGASTLHAFPPAPFHTIFGMVRDEHGQALRIDGATLILFKNGAEFLRTPIAESSRIDQNYQVRLRMDMQRLGTQSYTSLSSSTGAAFTLGVMLNDIVYYPIEMAQSRAIGRPGERVRIDLTLGVDADGDGIPDAWEQSQLYAAGIMPGEAGWDLTLITRDGDFDGDGIPNWHEYIAGTFATDPTDYLALQIVGSPAAYAQLRFFGIYAKVYSLESSTDLQTWTPTSVFLRDPVPPPIDPEDYDPAPFVPPAAQPSVRAEDTAFIDLYAPADASGRTFYRLKVR